LDVRNRMRDRKRARVDDPIVHDTRAIKRRQASPQVPQDRSASNQAACSPMTPSSTSRGDTPGS
jgi:hypothetical protein